MDIQRERIKEKRKGNKKAKFQVLRGRNQLTGAYLWAVVTGPVCATELCFLNVFFKIHVFQPWPYLAPLTYKYASNYDSHNASRRKKAL